MPAPAIQTVIAPGLWSRPTPFSESGILPNSHSWIHIDVKNEDGTVTNWMIEGGSPNALLRLGVTKNSLPTGTEIVVEGYQAKDRRATAVGKNVTFPDGKRMLLGGSANDPTDAHKK